MIGRRLFGIMLEFAPGSSEFTARWRHWCNMCVALHNATKTIVGGCKMYKCTVSLSYDNDRGPCPWKTENWAENDNFITRQTVSAVTSTIAFCLCSNLT